MSNQSYANQEVQYWLARTGVDAVSFVKQASPPLAWLNRGIMYELNDGVLYYNGSPIATGGSDPTFDSVTLDQQITNPGGADTFWTKIPSGHLFHGSKDMENYDAAVVYANPSGLTLAAGATGAVNSPVSTLAEANTLWNALGTTFMIDGDYSAESFALNAQTVLCGSCGPSFRVLVNNVTAAGPTWAVPPPFGLNQSYLHGLVLLGLVDFQAIGMTSPQLVLQNSVLLGGFQAADDDGEARFIMNNCDIETNCTVTNISGLFKDCIWGNSASLTVNHTGGQMSVQLSGSYTESSGELFINSSSATGTTIVIIEGVAPFVPIHVVAVGASGLNLVLDDFQPIDFAPGTEVLTNIQYVKSALTVGYSPAVPGDWSPPPVQVAEALDQLAATAGGAGDVNGPGASTDNAIVRFDGLTGKLIQDSTVLLSDAGISTYPVGGGVIFPNVVGVPIASTTLGFYQFGFITPLLAGPWLAPPSLLLLITRIGNVVSISVGSGALQAANALAPAAVTTTAALPAWAIPTSIPRAGTYTSVDNGVYGVGGWTVDLAGIITWTPTTDPTSTFAAPVLGLGGLGPGQTFTYAIA